MYSNYIVKIKETRSEDKIPVINDTHLHSAYNPIREADNFAEQKRDNLEENSNVLIFGLGFGYHVRAIEKILKEKHDDYKIIVIEPIQPVIDAFYANGFAIDEETTDIYHFENIEDYYQTEELVEFMVNKPVVISHPASFKLAQEFYKSFMGHHSSKGIHDISQLIKDESVKKYLENSEDQTISQLLNSLSETNRIETPEEFLFMSYKEIVTTNSTGELNE